MAAFCSPNIVSDCRSEPCRLGGSVSGCNVTATYDGRFVLHCLDTLLPLLEFESLIDYAFDPDLAAVEVVDCGWEFVGFAEGPNDRDLVAN